MGTRRRAEGGQERSRRAALGFTGSEGCGPVPVHQTGLECPPRSPRVGAPTSGPPLRQPSEQSGAGREVGRPVGGKGRGPVRSGRGPDQREEFFAASPAARAAAGRPPAPRPPARDGDNGKTGRAAPVRRGTEGRGGRAPRGKRSPPKREGDPLGGSGGFCFARHLRAGAVRAGNDPSAGSPTETLLRLLLPLDSQV